MALSLDGIASGLDTAALIADLMRLEAIPQTMLKTRLVQNDAKIVDFQSLNTRLASLATLAKTDSGASALKTFSVTSSSSAITVSSTTPTAAASLDITVGAVAQGQVSVTASMGKWPADPAVMTIVGADGVAHEITAESTSLADVASAINSSDAGVVATRVASGVDADGEPLYRLQLTSAETGLESSFSFHQGTAAEVTAGTATNLLTAPGAAQVRTAQDASVTLWAGTSAEQVITSASNTFTDLVAGVSVTVKAVTTEPATITVARDAAKSTAVAQALVSSISTTLGLIDSKTKTSTVTDSTGKDVTALGTFTGDGGIRGIRDNVSTAVSAPVNGRSPSEIGLSMDKNGSIEFDAEKFAAALAKDPEGTETMFAAIAARVAAAAASASNTGDGTLTSKIRGAESTSKTFSDQVESWDRRLDTREATLKRTYSALEVAMGKMNSQAEYIATQLASLVPTKK